MKLKCVCVFAYVVHVRGFKGRGIEQKSLQWEFLMGNG